MKKLHFRSSKTVKLFIFGMIFFILLGIYLYSKTDNTTKKELLIQIKDLNLTNNFNHYHIIQIIIVLFLTSYAIGLPLSIFILIYEITSYSYIICSYYTIYKLSGIIYGVISFIVNKGIYSIILLYIITINIKYIKKLLKDKNNIANIQYNNYIKNLIIIIATIINELFVYFIGAKILNLFIFLL